MEPTPEPVRPRLVAWVTSLVREHRERLIRVVRREGVDAEDAVECVQEAFHAFLVLPQARQLVEDRDGSEAILAVIARNIARNRRRKHDRSRPHLGDELTLSALADDDAPVDQLVAQAEDYALLVGCVSTLSEIQRRVVELRLLEERPGEDVASELGTTPGNVAVLLHRAKGRLRACVRE